MDKKDIYEHLAKIYLDASSKKKKRVILDSRVVRSIALVSILVVFGLIGLFLRHTPREDTFNSEVALVLAPGVLKINFNFDPAKKETYALDLKKLDMSRFSALAFSVKKANRNDTISLRVEFANLFNEHAAVYFKDISSTWEEYIVNLSDFDTIADWSEMTSLVFSVEEWNVREKQGVVYIENVRLLKN